MVAPGETLEGNIPVPSTYPNPLANNVNMQPMGWTRGEGAVSAQNAPINLGLGGGSGGPDKPVGLTWAFNLINGQQTDPLSPPTTAYLIEEGFDPSAPPISDPDHLIAQEGDVTLSAGDDYANTAADGDMLTPGQYLIYTWSGDEENLADHSGLIATFGWDPFNPANGYVAD